MASLLPNAKSQFLDGDGHPLAGGSIAFYVPGTTTASPTWQDAAATIPNTNPITLDGSGMAVIYGSGAYRSVLTDSAGNLVWDADTAEFNTASGLTITGGISAGSITTTGDGTFSNVTAQGTVTAANVTTSGTVTSGFISTNGTVQAGLVNATTMTANTVQAGLVHPTTLTADGAISGSFISTTGTVQAGLVNSTTVTADTVQTGLVTATTVDAVAMTLTGNLGAVDITAGGTLGASTISVSGTFAGSTSGWQLTPTGTSSFSGAFNLGINSGAGVLGTTFIAASDARVKTEVADVSLDDALRFARAMRAKVFMKDGSPDAGFIAQHAIANDFHRMVVTSETDDPRMAAGDDLSPIGRQLNLNYNHAIAYHHRMIEYLLDRIDDLEERLVSAR
jgi:hypothetical protein